MVYNKEVNNKHNSVILRIEWDENKWDLIKHLIKQKTVGKNSDEIF